MKDKPKATKEPNKQTNKKKLAMEPEPKDRKRWFPVTPSRDQEDTETLLRRQKDKDTSPRRHKDKDTGPNRHKDRDTSPPLHKDKQIKTNKQKHKNKN